MFNEYLESNSYAINSKGGLYYNKTYNYNLDLFTLASRGKSKLELIKLFINAYNENKNLAVANLLFNLDIRSGKGERFVFKILFHELCLKDTNLALKVLYLIPQLGRYDYILETLDTPLWSITIELIKTQLESDIKSDNPSLLAKWLPSVRTHNINNMLAIKIARDLNISIKEYRKTLSLIRNKLKIVEHNITNKTITLIDYEKVPSQAMKKYYNVFLRDDKERFNSYLNAVKSGTKKINASVIEPYQIIKEAIKESNYWLDDCGQFNDNDILNELWKNQHDVLDGNNTNAIVVADTSGSMWSYNMLPISCALGLALYIAERNKGIFHNTFINFSDNPTFQKLVGETLIEKLNSIDYDNWAGTTNIDKALELILNASKNSDKKESPSHLIIISDMEFDMSVKQKPNYKYWQDEYKKYDLEMPKIIFWCVSDIQMGIPICKHDNGAIIISGYTPKIFKGILNIENYNPVEAMFEILDKYIKLLE